MAFRGRHERRRGTAAVHTTVGESMPLNLSFGNFDFQEMKSLGQRGGGVRELATLLRRARRQTVSHSALLRSEEGIEQRNAELIGTALRRASGAKVKDDPKRLAKAMAKRRNKKRQSAKKWAERLDRLQKSVDHVVEDRAASRQMARARKDAKAKAKAKTKTKTKDKSQKQSGKGAGGKSKWSKKSGSVKGKNSGGSAKKGGKRKR